MKKHASFIVGLVACAGFLAAPAFAAEKHAAHHHNKAMPAAHHELGKHHHHKLACGDYAWQSAEWNGCHK